jgi:YfiH family protein
VERAGRIMIFKIYEKSVKLWHFDNLSKCEDIIHFFSARHRGYSEGAYASLNLGLNSGDNPMRVIENRELLASVLGISLDNFVTSWQEHGDHVRLVDMEQLESDVSSRKMPRVAADAMISVLPNVCLMNIVADCVSILLYDHRKGVIGIAHAGWRGTVKGIARNVVEKMITELAASPRNILAGIGPSIGPCCYEVGPDVAGIVVDNLGDDPGLITRRKSDGKAFFNLWQANKRQLIESGIPEKNIEIAGLCTACHHDDFFSYRFHGPKSGRMAAGIMKKSL